jgi:hypothetical protein
MAGLQLTSGDALIGTELQNLGFTVTAVEDAASTSTDAAGASWWSSRGASPRATWPPSSTPWTVPVLVNEGAIFWRCASATRRR